MKFHRRYKARTRRKPLIGIGLAGGVAILLGTAAYRKDADLRFACLSGHQPVSDESSEYGWGMDGFVDCSVVCSDEGGPRTFRTLHYSYKADYDSLFAAAESEVRQRGKAKSSSESGIHSWEISPTVRLVIGKGRYDPLLGADQTQAGWVHVSIDKLYKHGPLGYTHRYARNLLP